MVNSTKEDVGSSFFLEGICKSILNWKHIKHIHLHPLVLLTAPTAGRHSIGTPLIVCIRRSSSWCQTRCFPTAVLLRCLKWKDHFNHKLVVQALDSPNPNSQIDWKTRYKFKWRCFSIGFDPLIKAIYGVGGCCNLNLIFIVDDLCIKRCLKTHLTQILK